MTGHQNHLPADYGPPQGHPAGDMRTGARASYPRAENTGDTNDALRPWLANIAGPSGRRGMGFILDAMMTDCPSNSDQGNQRVLPDGTGGWRSVLPPANAAPGSDTVWPGTLPINNSPNLTPPYQQGEQQ